MNKQFTKKETKFLLKQMHDLLLWSEQVAGWYAPIVKHNLPVLRNDIKLYKSILAKLQVHDE
jgi:hypothetical protein